MSFASLHADTYIVKDSFLINVENDTSHSNHEVTSNASKFIPLIEHNRLYVASKQIFSTLAKP